MKSIKKHWGKGLLLVLLASVGFIIIHYDFNSYFSIESLKNNQHAFEKHYNEHLFLSILLFSIVNILCATFNMPGISIISVAGGAIFGSILGTLIVVVATSIGSIFSFLTARYLLGDYFQKKYQKQLSKVNKGIAEEGSLYLLSLRLIPLIPFFLINILMGLSKMDSMKFYIVSFFGLIPVTSVFVNAGSQLSQIDSLADVLSFKIIASFALIAILPYILKFLFKIKKNYKP